MGCDPTTALRGERRRRPRLTPGALACSLSWALSTLLLLSACGERVAATPEPAPEKPFAWPEEATVAVLHVAGRGAIELELYPALAPATVENFVKLARDGFYEGTTFHRVIPGFMIQGGDPNTRNRDPNDDGQGGPGYRIADEPNAAPHERGTLSMANTGNPNSGGSQFFIVVADSRELDGRYTAFGRVRAGMDVVDGITEAEVDRHGRWGPPNRPIENVVIERVEIR